MIAPLLLALAGTAHAAPCLAEERSEPVDLESATTVAREAAAQGSLPVLEAALTDAEQALTCMNRPLDSATIAPLHLAHGLALYARIDPAAPGAVDPVLPYLRLYREAFPPRQGDASGLPEGLSDYEEEIFLDLGPRLESLEEVPYFAPPKPLRGVVGINGYLQAVPRDTPYVFQRVGRKEVFDAEYVQPGELLPHYRRLRPTMFAAGVGTTLISAGFFTAARLTVVQMESWTPAKGIGNFATEQDWFTSKRVQNNVLFIGGSGAAVVALGTWGVWGASFVF